MPDYPVLDGVGGTIIAAAEGPSTVYPVRDGAANSILGAEKGPATSYPVLDGAGGTVLAFARDPALGGGGSPGTVLDAGVWHTAYAGAAVAHTVTGTVTVTGLPYGLSADTTGGLLTLTGTPV